MNLLPLNVGNVKLSFWLLWSHIETEHELSEPMKKCNTCDLIPTDDNELKVHHQTKHLVARVHIYRKKQICMWAMWLYLLTKHSNEESLEEISCRTSKVQA